MNKEQEKRILSKIKKTKTCWIWNAGLFPNGYGSVSINDHTYKASRVIYRLFYGDFNPKLLVLHKCDNKKCVNPKHLFLGTHKENMKDMTNKGRQARGESCGCSKLKEHQVLEIRKLFKASKFTVMELSRKFNVSHKLIGKIISRKAWKHI
jgi:hypothetical protein